MVEEPIPSSMAWGRAHFGAWSIVSSPLYHGFDLFNQTLMNSVLDVIGNREAIAVNQLWAGHPGRLAKEWKGDELNMSGTTYVWGVPCDTADSTQRGWSFDAAKQRLRAPSGRCVSHNASAAATLLTLEECHNDSHDDGLSQSFVYGDTNAASNLSFTDGSGAKYPLPPYAGFDLCLTLFGWQFPSCGDLPSAKMYPCLGDQTAQHWTHSGSTIADACGNCLVERRSPQAPVTTVQLWVKPQPGGAVAMLIINNTPQQQTPSVPLDAATLLGHATTQHASAAATAAAGQWKVRGIWEREDVGMAAGTFSPQVPPYDSGFYLLTPAAVP